MPQPVCGRLPEQHELASAGSAAGALEVVDPEPLQVAEHEPHEAVDCDCESGAVSIALALLPGSFCAGNCSSGLLTP